jgi:hypothetical protein
MSTAARLAQPRPTTAGYILAIAVGTGVAVTGALLPAQLSWWWLDTVAHVAGGATLALGLRIIATPRRTAVATVALSLAWEGVEWAVGWPFIISVPDTQLDLIAGWAGLAAVLVVARAAATR